VAKVDIYSLQGQLLLSDNKPVIDVNNLYKGMYLVAVTDKTGNKTTTRMIKD
jgi:hypothetical protein